MSGLGNLKSAVDEALALLSRRDDLVRHPVSPEVSVPLPSLLQQCQDLCAAMGSATAEPLRTVHHFACSGGTLMSKALAAQPNTVVLSEIDPYSTLVAPGFAPYDLIKQAQLGPRPISQRMVERTFLEGLRALFAEMTGNGLRVVIRDHAHSHFCTEADPSARPLLRDMLAADFALRSLVTVRHPLDSFLSLERNGWLTFPDGTLEDYSRRYLLFLDAYAQTPVVRYEEFVLAPEAKTRAMTDILDLPFVDHWQHLLGVIQMTGDSGRSGTTIAPRAREAVSGDCARQAGASDAYAALCGRLGYDPDPCASPFENLETVQAGA